MAHRIREGMRAAEVEPLGGEGKIVEADTTYIGGKKKNKHRSKHKKGNLGGKASKSFTHLWNAAAASPLGSYRQRERQTLRPVVMKQVRCSSSLMTDEGGEYFHLGKEYARHETVNHGAGEYVRGDAHSNTVEGYFATLNRGIIGTYHHVSEAHLKLCLAEFDFRYYEAWRLVWTMQRARRGP
jgi:hypothetical protein